MSFDVESAMAYNVANAPLRFYPYPHIYVPDVFPEHYYAEIQRNIPDPDAMIPIEEARPVRGYKERFVLEIAGHHVDRLPEPKAQFWRSFSRWLVSGRFKELMLAKFAPMVQQRFAGVSNIELYDEALLVQDITKYALGPHTDSPRKVITFLFYLPKDETQSHLGTSIYVPNDRTFTCQGGPHHGFENFTRIATMPFKPNALFAFVKTNNSFHGVEPVRDPDTRRWLLLYDIYVRPVAQQQQPVSFTAPQASNVTFKM